MSSVFCPLDAGRLRPFPTGASHDGPTRSETRLRRCLTTRSRERPSAVSRSPVSIPPALEDRLELRGSLHPRLSRRPRAFAAAPTTQADATTKLQLPRRPATATSYRAPPGAPTRAPE